MIEDKLFYSLSLILFCINLFFMNPLACRVLIMKMINFVAGTIILKAEVLVLNKNILLYVNM